MQTKRVLMACAPTDPGSSAAKLSPEGDDIATVGKANGASPVQSWDADHPRLAEEHHVVGLRGEDVIEATDELGRRWYHLRADSRGRAEFIGFNYAWWLFWALLIFMVILPWGLGWGD